MQSGTVHPEESQTTSRSAVSRYGAAVLAVAAMLGIRLTLEPVLGPNAPYLPLVLAVMFAARYGGRGPGLAATALSALGVNWFFIEPRYSLAIANPHAAAGLALFVVMSLAISLFVGDLGRALESAKLATEGLRRQTQLVDFSHDAIITMDANRHIMAWNAGAREMYGWEVQEALGNVTHGFLETSGNVSPAEIDAILLRDGRWEGELNHGTRDGHQIRVESRQVLIRDAHDHSIGILEINRDITEKVRAEEEARSIQQRLAISEERLRLALDAASMGTWDWNIQSGELAWSERCKTLFGLAPDAAITYEMFLAAVHADDRERVDSTVQKALAGKGDYDAELCVPLPDGTVRWVAANGRVSFDKAGKPLRMSGTARDITEHKRADEALREREQNLRRFTEVAPVAIAMFDREMRYLAVSQRFRDDFALGAQEVVGRSHYEIFPEISEQWREIHRRCLAGATERNPGEQFLRADGSEQWVRWEIQPWRQGDGSIGGIVLFSEDITLQRCSEQALRESETQFRDLANAIPQLCWTANGEGWLSWYNQRWYEYTGTTPEQMEGWGWQSVHDPEALPQVLERWKDSIATGKPFDMVFPLRGADGVFRPFLTRVMPVRDHDGKVVRWFGTNTDISEQRKNEQALRDSEARYRSLFESIQEGFAVGEPVCDAAGEPIDWRYLDVNPALAVMLGHSHDEIVGHTYRELFPEASNWQSWAESFGRVALTGNPAHLDQYGDGTHRHYDAIVYSPVRGQFAAILTDVSERKKAEERLRHAQKLESIGLLAGGIAHDFNNLLTVIMGNASSALVECPECQYSQAILSASERAAYLTKQLLAYAGKGEFVKKSIDLSALVSRSKQLLAASVPKRVTLAFNLPEGLPSIEEDPSRVEQILMNLVINAGESIPLKSDGRIGIATSHCEVTPETINQHSQAFEIHPGLYVCLEVRDNGSGMDEDTMARIFDPFFSTKFTGRGLGLAAVHGIVRSSKGFIDLHSSPGNGSTFQVFLPASATKRSAQAIAETEPVAPRQRERKFATVLVVDDEEMVRKLASMTLRWHGYDVLEAEDGKEALQVLAESSTTPALIFLDLAMPVMGGDELVPILEEKYPDMKILATSGYAEQDARQRFPRAAVSGFLQKPYMVNELAEKIEEVIGSSIRA